MEKLRTFLKRYSAVVAYVGLVVLLLALISYIVAQRVDTMVQGLLLLGAALLALFIVLESVKVHTSLTGRVARYGTNSVLMIVAFVGIMVMVNTLSDRHHWRWDLTASKQYSISEQTVNILKGLKEPAKVVGFFSTANASQAESQATLENLLKSYMLYTDKLTYQFIDPDLKPTVARQYAITSYGTVVFERGTKKQQTMTVDEQSLTSALLKVSRDEVKGVYFLTGHKEHTPEDTGDAGYSTIKANLEKDNYKVGTLNLAITNTVPTDMSALVIAAPQVPLEAREIEMVSKYLQNGGKALILADPAVPDPFGDLLSQWGIKLQDDVVIDPGSSFPQDASTLVVSNYDFPDITKGVAGLISFFPGVRSLEKMQNVTDTLTLSPVFQSSQGSWGETDYRNTESVGFDQGKDFMGPLSFAMAVTSSASKTRLVVVGGSGFAANGVLRSVRGTGNQDLLNGMINWLSEEEALVSISPKTPEQRFLVLPPGSSRLVIFSSLILLPLVVIAAGIAVWWHRR